jgi:hypothetical protein
VPYFHPFVIARKGTHTVVFRTLDDAGTVLAETARLLTIERGGLFGMFENPVDLAELSSLVAP